MWIHSSYEIIVRQYEFIYEDYEFIETMNSYIYEFIVAENEFIYACIWIHIHYEFIYLWIHIINYKFIVDTMNSYLPRIHLEVAEPECSRIPGRSDSASDQSPTRIHGPGPAGPDSGVSRRRRVGGSDLRTGVAAACRRRALWQQRPGIFDIDFHGRWELYLDPS